MAGHETLDLATVVQLHYPPPVFRMNPVQRRLQVSKWSDDFFEATRGWSNLAKIAILLGSILVFLALIVLLPFGLLWALKTLFSISIGYSFKTWVAAFLVLILLNGGHAHKNNG